MKNLFSTFLLLTSTTIFAASTQVSILVSGSGANCEEASAELMQEISHSVHGAVVTGISMQDCQSPDMAQVEQKAFIKLAIPES